MYKRYIEFYKINGENIMNSFEYTKMTEVVVNGSSAPSSALDLDSAKLVIRSSSTAARIAQWRTIDERIEQNGESRHDPAVRLRQMLRVGPQK